MKISIVTVCKNSERTIERCIRSVINQSHEDIEYIVIDGSSTDRTLSILKDYQDHIATLVSEPDSGIYNAMNKGIAYVNGDIVYFLNSDDYFYDPNVILDVASEFRRNEECLLAYGDIKVVKGTGTHEVKYQDITPKFFYKNTICHQAIFAKRELFDIIGHFNEDYKIHADVDWLMRAYFNPTIRDRLRYIDRMICYFSGEGMCSNDYYANKYKFDREKISAQYFLEARIKRIIKNVLRSAGVIS